MINAAQQHITGERGARKQKSLKEKTNGKHFESRGARRSRNRDDARSERSATPVFDAFTKPELLRRWLGAFAGWEFAVCEIDLRVGGKYRWVWRNADGTEMGMGGVYREIVPPEKIVSTEKFDEAWYPGEGLGTVVFTEQAGKTTVTQTVRYESRETRDGVLKSPMETGVVASYNKLEEILGPMVAGA